MYPPKVINLDECEGPIEYIDVLEDYVSNPIDSG